MKICVTGATGYIGSLLTMKLLNDGHEVHVLVRSTKKTQSLFHKNLIVFIGNIQKTASLEKVMKGCTQVYHLAALAKVWTKNSDDFFTTNVLGTQQVLECALKYKIKRIVVCSTAGVWGPSLNGPISEESTRGCDFFNEYESSKSMCELLVKNYIIQKNLDIVIVSPTRVYGPNLIGKSESVTYLIEKFINKKWKIIPGNGEKTGNYIFINDVVNGLNLAMEKGRNGHTYILGGTNHTLNEFFETLKKVSNVHVKMYNIPIWLIMLFARFQYFLANNFNINPLITPKWIAKSKYHWSVSSKKAQKELGLEVTPLEKGLKETVEWMKLREQSDKLLTIKI